MTVGIRSYLTAGVAAVAASAVVTAPVQAPVPTSMSLDSVRLSAAVQTLIEPADAASKLLGLVTDPGKPSTNTATTTLAAAASTQSAAGDWVISAWNWADYWIGYGADLVQYALGWVWPLSLIGDQAPILWDNLGSPIGDAAVYGLIVPVLNDPFNLSVWAKGLTTVASTTVTALVNTAIAEFNYFVGWLLPPLPPLPIPPLPGLPLSTSLTKFATPQVATFSVENATGPAATLDPQDLVDAVKGAVRQPAEKFRRDLAVAAQDVVDTASQVVTATVEQVKQIRTPDVPTLRAADVLKPQRPVRDSLANATSTVQTALLSAGRAESGDAKAPASPIRHDSSSESQTTTGGTDKPDHSPVHKKPRQSQSDSAE
ncbi:MAG TPA: hypothetical protein VMD51_15475 [Mycobacterium sp.]|nr:hypothetical protein [Mycobacterium sp.]